MFGGYIFEILARHKVTGPSGEKNERLDPRWEKKLCELGIGRVVLGIA